MGVALQNDSLEPHQLYDAIIISIAKHKCTINSLKSRKHIRIEVKCN